jgi:hypothetical protein
MAGRTEGGVTELGLSHSRIISHDYGSPLQSSPCYENSILATRNVMLPSPAHPGRRGAEEEGTGAGPNFSNNPTELLNHCKAAAFPGVGHKGGLTCESILSHFSRAACGDRDAGGGR